MVDLKKFRRIAAGDRLRGQYQGLSQDPNSLSNLDQVSFICVFLYFYILFDKNNSSHFICYLFMSSFSSEST